MGLFEKKSTFRKFIDSITNAIYDNPDLGPEFMEELEEGLVMSDIGIDTSDAIMKELDTAINERYIIKEKQIKKNLLTSLKALWIRAKGIRCLKTIL
jgi:fused signal recognition particle receptor